MRFRHPTRADLTRYVVNPTDASDVRRHLEQGCSACSDAVAGLREQRNDQERPVGLVAVPRSWLIPELAPAGAGMRAAGRNELLLTSPVGPYHLVWLARDAGDGRVEISGQLRLENQPAGDLDLQFTRTGGGFSSWTRTDGFGEFDLTINRNGAYGLRVACAPPWLLVWDSTMLHW